MDPNIRYLAEEVAENHRDGLLSRREAMRRLTRLGFGAVAASSLLAACGGGGGKAAGGSSTTAATAAPATGPTTTTPAVTTQDITYPGDGIPKVMGAWAPARSPQGAVLVIHENQGLSPFIRQIAGRIAGSGYSALAVDLLSAQGGTAAHPDPADVQSLLGQNSVAGQTVKDMRSSLSELQRRVPGARLAATGFCFGGNMTWDLLAAGDPPPLAAAVPFYGQAANPVFSKTHAAVLAIYAGLDTRVNANQQTAKSGLDDFHLIYDIQVFPGVNHAFMNSTGASYDPTQAEAAYQAMMAWFAKYVR